ncbi:exodeoxyribonuclease VII large subunit [bacterium]|nr:exodeoxyribonuclease VII large subunit [bacterium]
MQKRHWRLEIRDEEKEEVSIDSTDQQRKVYSVSELVESARGLLEGAFSRVWVEGEISNFKHHSSGHFYLTLKDSGSQLRAAMFRGANRTMRFKTEDGLKVIALGRLSLYTARGDFQMVIESMEPAGLGALQLAYEQLKKKLAAEGLFDPGRKKILPEFPRRIVVITSPTGAAIRDILNVTGRRSPLADISIYPVRVQGDGSAKEIAHAVNRLNEIGGWDVIICGRGGGSLEDLWAFNEEIVARAIAASEIPVISAVGHEVDYTIADFTADVRAETPTAAAEMVVRDRREMSGQVKSLQRHLSNRMYEQLNSMRQRLDRATASRFLQKPLAVFEPMAQRLDDLTADLRQSLTNRLRFSRQELKGRIAQLEALSPLKVMSRGYSLVYKQPDNQLIKSSKSLKQGDQIRIKLSEGQVECDVNKTKEIIGNEV